MNKKNTIFTVIFALSVGALLFANTSSAQSADCDPYGICPPEVKGVAFSLTKLVKKIDSSEYTNSVTVKPGETVDFLIRVENTGDLKADSIRIIDYLPAELTLVEGQLIKDITDLKVGEQKELNIKVKAKETLTDNICVNNTAQLEFNGKPANTAVASVCVKKGGTVLGDIKTLPDTAFQDTAVAFSVIALLAGAFMLTLSATSSAYLKECNE